MQPSHMLTRSERKISAILSEYFHFKMEVYLSAGVWRAERPTHRKDRRNVGAGLSPMVAAQELLKPFDKAA